MCEVESESPQESHRPEFTAGKSFPPNHFKAVSCSCFLTRFRAHRVGFVLIDCSGKQGGPWGDDLERGTSWTPARSHIQSKRFTVGQNLRVIERIKGQPSLPVPLPRNPPPSTRLRISCSLGPTPHPRSPLCPGCLFPSSQLHLQSLLIQSTFNKSRMHLFLPPFQNTY